MSLGVDRTRGPSYAAVATRGGLFASVGYGMSQLITLLSYVILARLVTPAEFGVFAAGSIISAIGMIFAESGILAALITRRECVEEAANTAFVWSVVFGFGLAVLSLALSPVVALMFNHREIGEVCAALSGVVWLRALSIVPDALLQRRLSFLRRVAVDPLSMLAFGGVAIGLTSAGAGVWGLVLGTYASMSMRTIGIWGFARWRPYPRTASIAMWRELVSFARHLTLSEAIRHVVANLDTFLIGRFVGPAPLGQYRYAQRIAGQAIGAWVNVGAYVILPVFAQMSDDLPRLRAACVRVMHWMAVALFPIALLMSGLGPAIATLVFGPEWRQAGEALIALAGLSIGQAIVSIASEAFKVVGEPAELPKMHGVAAIASLACMLALLPFGMIGVAGGVSLGACIVAGYAIARMRAVVGIPVRAVFRVLIPPLMCAAFIAVVGYALESQIVHADSQGTLAGLLILSGVMLGLLLLYILILSIISPSVRRALGKGSSQLFQRVTQRHALTHTEVG